MHELEGYLGILPFYGAALYLVALFVQKNARGIFPLWVCVHCYLLDCCFTAILWLIEWMLWLQSIWSLCFGGVWTCPIAGGNWSMSGIQRSTFVKFMSNTKYIVYFVSKSHLHDEQALDPVFCVCCK